jgi:acyl carrier protein
VNDWDDRFEQVLRSVLPDLPPTAGLTPDLDLTYAGLTSMGIIQLLVCIEDTYGRSIPDDRLTPRVFSTPGDLWAEVSKL